VPGHQRRGRDDIVVLT